MRASARMVRVVDGAPVDRGAGMSMASVNDVASMRADGLTWETIGKRYGASATSAMQWFKRRTEPGWYERELANRRRSEARSRRSK